MKIILTHTIALNLFTDIGLIYGLLSALTDIAKDTILWTVEPRLKTELDSSYLWTSVFHGIVDMMLEILDKYGYNPSLRDNVTRDHFPDVDGIREYFLDNGSYAGMRQAVWGFGDGDYRKKIGEIMGSSRGWQHLFEGRAESYTQQNVDDRLLVVLLIYVLDKANKIHEMRQEYKDTKIVQVDDLQRNGLWMYGSNTKFTRYSKKGRNALGVSVDGEPVTAIDKPEVWVHKQSPHFSTLSAVVDNLFIPKDSSAVDPNNAGANLRMMRKSEAEVKGREYSSSPKKRKNGGTPDKGGKKQAKMTGKVVAKKHDDWSDSDDSSSESVHTIESNDSESVSESTKQQNEDDQENETITTAKTESSRATATSIVNDENKKEMLTSLVQHILDNPNNFHQLNALLKGTPVRENDESNNDNDNDEINK